MLPIIYRGFDAKFRKSIPPTFAHICRGLPHIRLAAAAAGSMDRLLIARRCR